MSFNEHGMEIASFRESVRRARRPEVEAAEEDGADEPGGQNHAVGGSTVTGKYAASESLSGMTESGPNDDAIASPDALLAACSRRAAETRREVAEVAEALSGSWRGRLTDRQRAQIGNMLRRLIGEVEATLHSGLVAALERRDDLRPDIVTDFAGVPEGGAYEHLVARGTLLDSALVEAALHRMLEHALESELRPSIIDPWHVEPETSPLHASPAGRALDQMAGEPLRDYMVDRTGLTDGYGEPVIRLDDLDPALVARLHWRLAALLRMRAAAVLECRPSELDAEIQRSVQSTIDAAADRTRGLSAVARAAEALSRSRTLDGELLLDILRRADVPLFFAVFARLTGLRPALVRRLAFDPDGLGLAIASRAVRMTADQFAALYRITRHARTSARAEAADNIDRQVEMFNRITAENAARVCDYWRLPSEYLDAVWRVGRAVGDRPAERR